MKKALIIYIFVLFFISCAGSKKSIYFRNLEHITPKFYLDEIKNEDREILLHIKLMYLTLLDMNNQIIEAYSCEERALQNKHIIKETVSKGGMLIFGKDIVLMFGNRKIVGNVSAIEVDLDFNVIKAFVGNKLPRLKYIDNKGNVWKKDSFGNIQIEKLLNAESNNLILLSSENLARFLESLKKDIDWIHKEINLKSMELEFGERQIISGDIDFNKPVNRNTLEKTKEYIEILKGWGGTKRWPETYYPYSSFDDLPTSVEKQRIGSIFYFWGKKPKVFRLIGIESGGTRIFGNYGEVYYGELAMQFAINFMESRIAEHKKFLIYKKLNQYDIFQGTGAF